MGHAVKQPKNCYPWNQDLTPKKIIFEGVQNPSFEYQNNNYYNFIITIVLYSQLYQKITRCFLYKNCNGMSIALVSREKIRKIACVLNGTEVLSTKATTNKHMPSPTLSTNQLIIIFLKKRQNTSLVTDQIIQ